MSTFSFTLQYVRSYNAFNFDQHFFWWTHWSLLFLIVVVFIDSCDFFVHTSVGKFKIDNLMKFIRPTNDEENKNEDRKWYRTERMYVLEPAKKYSVNYATRRIESLLSSNLFPNSCVNDIKKIMISNCKYIENHENECRRPISRCDKFTFPFTLH